MKPVDKGEVVLNIRKYGDAKPYLLERLGLHCSYCEQPGSPQNLHVEHIYPKKPHSELECEWDNFLLSCSTCNIYKHHYLGSSRQSRLATRFVWPHIDNTLRVFVYFDDGRVEVLKGLSADVDRAAVDTLEMIGAMKSPLAAGKYVEDIAYDGMDKRKEMWEIAIDNRQGYLNANGAVRANSLARNASKMGHFSIWMAVFFDLPEVRSALIDAFKAAKTCFGNDMQPVQRGRV